MNLSLKRALWCRWFHRYHRAPIPDPPPGTPPHAAIITSRFVRRWCRACEDADYGSCAGRRKLAA